MQSQVSVPGGKRTVRTSSRTSSTLTGWFDALPEAVRRHLKAAEMTRPLDFAMSFTSPQEVLDELEDVELSADDSDAAESGRIAKPVHVGMWARVLRVLPLKCNLDTQVHRRAETRRRRRQRTRR